MNLFLKTGYNGAFIFFFFKTVTCSGFPYFLASSNYLMNFPISFKEVWKKLRYKFFGKFLIDLIKKVTSAALKNHLIKMSYILV